MKNPQYFSKISGKPNKMKRNREFLRKTCFLKDWFVFYFFNLKFKIFTNFNFIIFYKYMIIAYFRKYFDGF